MSMEIHEEAILASPNNNSSSSVSNDQYSPGVAKGKRSKRQRLLQLPAPAATAASSSMTSSSEEFSGSATEEEEDMAHCLILLAQGSSMDAGPKTHAEEETEPLGISVGDVVGSGGGERFTSRRLAEAATTTNGKVGFYVYECKTCNKCFPSFQALGGHRASHKRPRTAAPPVTAMEEIKKATHHEDLIQIRTAVASNPNPTSTGGSSAATPALIANSAVGSHKARVHECSICGSEFSSGQALGGHMRRHRAAAVVSEPLQEPKKEKTILSLDLNLPAPMEDDRGDLPKSPPFPFSGKQSLIFSASTLVDCHY